MTGRTIDKLKNALDKIADAALPKFDDSKISERAPRWWIFVMPGKVILWLEYMFPHRIGSVFGSARRRNIPLIQIVYSIYFYIGVAFVLILAIFIVAVASTR